MENISLIYRHTLKVNFNGLIKNKIFTENSDMKISPISKSHFSWLSMSIVTIKVYYTTWN